MDGWKNWIILLKYSFSRPYWQHVCCKRFPFFWGSVQMLFFCTHVIALKEQFTQTSLNCLHRKKKSLIVRLEECLLPWHVLIAHFLHFSSKEPLKLLWRVLAADLVPVCAPCCPTTSRGPHPKCGATCGPPHSGSEGFWCLFLDLNPKPV